MNTPKCTNNIKKKLFLQLPQVDKKTARMVRSAYFVKTRPESNPGLFH